MKRSIVFKKFDLRTDLVPLFSLMMDNKEQALFHGKISINSLQNFEEWVMGNMSRVYHDFYVLVTADQQSPVGYAYSYDFHIYDGYCKICVFLRPENKNNGIGALSGILFLDELFTNYPLRKIYVDIYDYNKQSLKTNLDGGFVEEGCLKEVRYYNGFYYDLHMLSITRDSFYEKNSMILEKYNGLSQV